MSHKHFLALVLLSFTIAVSEPGWAKGGPKALIVSSSNPACAGGSFSRIQDAIDVVTDGQQVMVCPGMYPESLVITTSLKLKLATHQIILEDPLTGEPHVWTMLDQIVAKYKRFGFNFAPLVRRTFGHLCDLEIQFSCRKAPKIAAAKDRELKDWTNLLFEALRLPRYVRELLSWFSLKWRRSSSR